jgi:DNA-binding NarL/FixJ family response regulator
VQTATVGTPSEKPQLQRLRVVVADDHRPMRETLVRLLTAEFEVVAAVTDGHAVVAEATRSEPDVLVLDIAMPGLSGIAAATQLRAGGSTARVVFVTMHSDREFVDRALELGTVGFVVKDRLFADLVPAIRAVEAGQTFVSPSIAR